MNWIVTTNEYKKELIPHNGNKFLTGNGFFGVRGTMEEAGKEDMSAINLAGVYDKVGDGWRESVNAPNVLYTVLSVDGKTYALPTVIPTEHSQSLDFRNALQMRKTVWETEKGKITLVSERFASMKNQSIIALKYTVSADYDCLVTIDSGINGDIWDIYGPHFVSLEISEENGVKTVKGTTGEKNITVTAKECIKTDFNCDRKTVCTEKAVIESLTFEAKANESYTVFKTASVEAPVLSEGLDVSTLSYNELKADHIREWEKIWDTSMIEIVGDDEAMYALNYSIYHLNIIAPRNLRNVSIAARGLSGQVYKGAVFWDTEMFMIDYFIHTDPKVAKTLIDYRIDTLSGARNKAREYGLDGAYYAWESQEGGFEGCSDYNITDVFTKRPMRTYFRDKQYHVSAAVVYGICKYIEATNDTTVFRNGGAEVIIECARMYRSLLLKKADSPFYEIRDVVGPDEYHERVSNNAYTNKMVQLTFKTAIEAIETLRKSYPDIYDELDKKCDLEMLRERFSDSKDNIKIKEPDERGIIEQFDGYFNLEDVSVDEVRSRLLNPKEYWGGAYGVASDTQVLKQADVVAMLAIFNKEYNSEILKKNFDYYEPRTEHGSSLSACMYSLLACQTGNPDTAYPLFMKSAGVDLKPGGKEWMGLVYIGGTHPASEGGAWIVAVKGFAGIGIENGQLVSNPCLPEKWEKMKFKLMFCGKLYEIEADKNGGKIKEAN